MASFALALAAIHALRPDELRAFKLADLDLPRARLTVRTPGRAYMSTWNAVTLGCADAWLRDRHDEMAPHGEPAPVHQPGDSDRHRARQLPAPQPVLHATGITASQLREDRILDEARRTADAVRLMRLFGISDTTAMKYVFTAHPERQAVLPR